MASPYGTRREDGNLLSDTDHSVCTSPLVPQSLPEGYVSALAQTQLCSVPPPRPECEGMTGVAKAPFKGMVRPGDSWGQRRDHVALLPLPTWQFCFWGQPTRSCLEFVFVKGAGISFQHVRGMSCRPYMLHLPEGPT